MSESFVSIDDLIPDSANARQHPDRNVQLVRGSLKRFKAARSIVVDSKGVVRAGNATLDAARDAGITRVRIVKSDGSELIAVQRDDWSDTEAVAYAIADNHTGETSEWNKPVLAQQLDALPAELLEVIGFDASELDKLFDTDAVGGNIDEDRPPAPSLANRFGVPPFSVLDARQGYWQERKRAWIALGIKSELGRGENTLGLSSECEEYRGNRY